MELEELFANRALLKKMSAQDHIQMHVLCKGTREPNSLPLVSHSPKNDSANNLSGYNSNNKRPLSLSTPRNSTTKPPSSVCSLNNPIETFNTPSGSSYSSLNKPPSSTSSSIKPPTSLTSLNKHPVSLNGLTRPPNSFISLNKPQTSSTSLNTSIRSAMIKPAEPILPPIVLVPDGYGCKLPKTFQRCTDAVKIAFLFLYILGLPIILYQLHTKLQNTRRRIHMLNNNKVELLRSELVYVKQKQAGPDEGYLVKEKMKDYKEMSLSQDDDAMLQMDSLRREVQDADDHWYHMVSQVEEWLKHHPYFFNRECFCQACPDCPAKETRGKYYTNLSTVQPSATTRKQLLKNYIKWGSNVCEYSGNSSATVALSGRVIYDGIMVTTSNLRGSTGANFLCLPVHPAFEFNEDIDVDGGVSLIYNSLVDLTGYQDLRLSNSKKPGFFLAHCALCEVPVVNIVTIPGTTLCPLRWKLLYAGNIMAQRVGKKRTQFLCVDASNLQGGSHRVEKSKRIFSSLNFVETRCHGLPCLPDGYTKYTELHCVVCSK